MCRPAAAPSASDAPAPPLHRYALPPPLPATTGASARGDEPAGYQRTGLGPTNPFGAENGHATQSSGVYLSQPMSALAAAGAAGFALRPSLKHQLPACEASSSVVPHDSNSRTSSEASGSSSRPKSVNFKPSAFADAEGPSTSGKSAAGRRLSVSKPGAPCCFCQWLSTCRFWLFSRCCSRGLRMLWSLCPFMQQQRQPPQQRQAWRRILAHVLLFRCLSAWVCLCLRAGCFSVPQRCSAASSPPCRVPRQPWLVEINRASQQRREPSHHSRPDGRRVAHPAQ